MQSDRVKGEEMIDIHAHILPGIDDGAMDMYDTLEMARIAADSGITRMIATPHCNLPGLYQNYFGEAYVSAVKKAREAIRKEGIPLELLPGMEVFSTPDLPGLLTSGKIMPLNQGRYLLMEFSFEEDPEYVEDLLERVCPTGVRPVIAHAERYHFVQDDPQLAYEWRKKGYLIQINKGSVLGKFGERAMDTAYALLEHHLVSAVASDAHSPLQRTPYMQDAWEALSGRFPERYLKILFEENPRRICESLPTQRFPLKSFLSED